MFEDRETAVILLEQRTAVHVQRPGERIAEARGHVASVRPDVFDGLLDQREGIAALDARLRQTAASRQAPLMPISKLLQVRPDHGLTVVRVVVRRQDEAHLRREGPELVAKAVAARDREILERLVPAPAGITLESRDRRKLAGVLREDERDGHCRGESFRHAVIDFGQHAGGHALPDREERAVGQDVAGVVHPLPGKRDRSHPGRGRERLSRRRGGQQQEGDGRASRRRGTEITASLGRSRLLQVLIALRTPPCRSPASSDRFFTRSSTPSTMAASRDVCSEPLHIGRVAVRGRESRRSGRST